MLLSGELEAVVDEAVTDELAQQEKAHAVRVATEKETEAKTKPKVTTTGAKKSIAPIWPEPSRRSVPPDGPKKRTYKGEEAPLVADGRVSPVDLDEDGKPKRKLSKRPLLPVGPKMPAMMRGRTRTVSRSATRSRGRGGPER